MHRSTAELEEHLDHIVAAPKDRGTVEMIVARPDVGEREIRETARLQTDVGLVGDNWLARGASSTPDGSADPYAQITLMNARVVDAVAGDRDRWPLAGDQIYVDLRLDVDTLPAGARLAVGSAVVEISPTPHTGCAKFSTRFGAEALRFVNVGAGRAGRFRGVNAFVVEDGDVRQGDLVIRR